MRKTGVSSRPEMYRGILDREYTGGNSTGNVPGVDWTGNGFFFSMTMVFDSPAAGDGQEPVQLETGKCHIWRGQRSFECWYC